MIMASELSMNGRKKIETIQKEFTQKFPYLTLVFLDQKRTAIDVSKSLSEVRQAKGADISIIASLKVNTLEKRFNESFGLIVEVAYQKEGKVIYTKENVDKTLNELNKWCAAQACEPFEFKKAFTGNTISSVQEQLFAAIKKVFADAEAKKINKDNFLDIYIPSVSPARGTHLFFNTSKNDIKIGYYTRDEKFINLVTDANFVEIEAASNGLRIKGNPTYTSVPSAIPAALNFLGGILNDKSFILDDGIKIEYDTESLDDFNERKAVEHKTKNERSSEVDEVEAFNKAITAFKKQNLDAVAAYVEAGNPVLQFSSNNDVIDNFLISMVSGGDLDQGRLDQYLSKGLDINATTSDDDAYTACHFAAWDGNDEALSILIDAGADPDVVGGDTMTPLNLAAANGHLDCIKILIDNNVNLDNRVLQDNIYHGDNGGTALRDAVLNQLWDIADVLIESGASVEVLNEKCSNGEGFFDVIVQLAKDSEDPKLHLKKIDDLKRQINNSQGKSDSNPEDNESDSGVDEDLDEEENETIEANDEDENYAVDYDGLLAELDDPFERFSVTEEKEVQSICSKIEKNKILTNLLYVNMALSENDFEVDKHQAYFFDSAVLVSDRELEGFLLVNMDGFYSNCVNENELTILISWGAVTDLRYSESDGDSAIDIVTDQGELTIKKMGSISLKILFTFYKSVWEDVNEKFRDEPFINWNEVAKMGIKEVGFSNVDAYKSFKID
jgi:ankyrin repeat protein